MQPSEVSEDSLAEFEDARKESAQAGEGGQVEAPPEASPPPTPVRDFETGSVESEDREVDHGVEAEFMLESSAVCPHCLEDIDRVHIVRMLRTKVNFVSSLPRRGQLLICPKCRIALAGALGGLI